MSDGLDELRRDLVVLRGLDPAAVQFIGGTTVAEIEASVDGFAKLVGQHEQEQIDPFAVWLANAATEKATRQRALIASLHGPQPQPRDERGRWAGGSFDGGARESVPVPIDPAAEHVKLVGALASASRVYRGVSF